MPSIAAESPAVAASSSPFSLHAELGYSYLPFAVLSDSTALPPLFQAGVSGEAGVEAWMRERWGMRLAVRAFRINPSSLTASGELYRGWEGFSASLGAGYGFTLGDMKSEIFACAGLSAARYLDTDLVFAYPSIMARFSLDRRFGSGEYLSLAIPVGLMLRGGAIGYSLGIETAIGFATGFAGKDR
jgi:hypothetical protein